MALPAILMILMCLEGYRKGVPIDLRGNSGALWIRCPLLYKWSPSFWGGLHRNYQFPIVWWFALLVRW